MSTDSRAEPPVDDLPTLLVLEDDPPTSEIICGFLKDHGFQAIPCHRVHEAFRFLRQNTKIHAMLVDLSLPDGDGIEVMREALLLHPRLPCFILTAMNSVDSAVVATKAGAENYFIKPFDPELIVSALNRAIPLYQSFICHQDRGHATRPHRLVWKSPKMLKAIELAHQAARTMSPVLLTGARSVGKTSVAALIYEKSRLNERPMITLDPATMSPTEIEIELFGIPLAHAKDGTDTVMGRLENLRGRTLYLENIESLGLAAQGELHRWISGKRHQVFNKHTFCRLITSSTSNLSQAIATGEFRQDLWYALAVYPIEVPSLAERREDILQLSENIITRICVTKRLRRPNLTRRANEFLVDHTWPGNLSELENTLEHAVTHTQDGLIEPSDLSLALRNHASLLPDYARQGIPPRTSSIDDITKAALIDALDACGGNRRRASLRLKTSLRTIYNMIHRYDLGGSNASK